MAEGKGISVPAELDGHDLIASVSGGKDSTALMLALREAGLPFRAVFADTGWEAPETYAYLAELVDRLGIWIERVGVPGGMRARVAYRAGFPARMQRWCTRELKIEPIRDYHGQIHDQTGRPTAVIVGVRAEESPKRALLPEITMEAEGPRGWGWPVWRPLIDWTVEDVLRIHNRHGVPVNPLYRHGFGRVGCWPCIFSRKGEIRLLAEHEPTRIDEIEQLERETTELRQRRLEERPDRYAHATAAFFQGREGGRRGVYPGIRTVVEWSQTSHGGRQLQLLPELPREGCYRWGLCEPVGSKDG
jgi:3'-phosphoadenosine 5'-phosphosulfate sulfotransferase (PAPS reductase)/FAD synthetase